MEGRSRESVDTLVLTASGGPFRGKTRDDLVDVTPAEALAHPTWNMGPKITVDSATLANKGLELIEAHFLFELPYERIEVVVHPTSIVHALVRFRDGATLAHLGYPDMRVPISYALTYPERAATPIPSLDLARGLTLEFGAPDVETFPMLALARRAGELGGTYPCAYNAANEVAVAAFLDGRLPFLGIAEVVEETLSSADGAPPRDRDDLVEADAQARRPRRARSTGLSLVIAILGLAFLILVHEAGHFFAARLVGMRPTRFYIGFPPALVKRTSKQGIEYGIGAIPLGGYVKIPGMHRMSASDVDAHLGPALEEAPQLYGPAERLKRALGESREQDAQLAVEELQDGVDHSFVSPGARRAAERGVREAREALSKEAYWRQKTWKRVLVIFAGPGMNLLFAIILFAALFMAGGGKATATVGSVVSGEPAMRAGLKPGDKIYAINGVIVNRPQDIPARISGIGRKEGPAAQCPEGRQVDPGAEASARAQDRRPLSARLQPRRTGVVPARRVLELDQADGRGHETDRRLAGQPRSRRGTEGHLQPRRDRAGLLERAQARGAGLPLGAWTDQPLARAAQPPAAAAARRRPHRLLDRGGNPRPGRQARDLRARVRRRNLPGRACSSLSACPTTLAV